MEKKFEYKSEHVFEALKALAILHMSGVAYNMKELEKEGTNIGEKYKDLVAQIMFTHGSKWTEAGFKAVKAVALENKKYGRNTKYEKLIESDLLDAMFKTYDICKGPKSKMPYSWIHQDLWNNNLMFKYENENSFSDPKHCVVVDFGVSSYLPVTVDVLMVIYMNTRKAHREEMFEKYQEFYYNACQEELKRHGISNLFSLQNLKEDCDDLKLLALVQKCVYVSSTYLPAELLIDMSSNDEIAYNKYMMEDRDSNVLDYMRADDWYKELLTEATEELVEFLYI